MLAVGLPLSVPGTCRGYGRVVQQVGRSNFDPAIIEAVRNLGVAVEVLDEAEHCGQSSYLIGVAIGRESGRLMGGIAKPFNGVVVAD